MNSRKNLNDIKHAGTANKKRCAWAGSSELMAAYHDNEWGIPVHDDRLLFEMLNLEGAQAGLSWQTILIRRATYRKAFDNFNAEKVANYDDSKRDMLLKDAGIIRNRLKINAVIENARAYLDVKKEFNSFSMYVWGFTNDKTLVHPSHSLAIKTSKEMSKDLKKRGFRFIGPTTCYAFMQAVGIVNDHDPDCFRTNPMTA